MYMIYFKLILNIKLSHDESNLKIVFMDDANGDERQLKMFLKYLENLIIIVIYIIYFFDKNYSYIY